MLRVTIRNTDSRGLEAAAPPPRDPKQARGVEAVASSPRDAGPPSMDMVISPLGALGNGLKIRVQTVRLRPWAHYHLGLHCRIAGIGSGGARASSRRTGGGYPRLRRAALRALLLGHTQACRLRDGQAGSGAWVRQSGPGGCKAPALLADPSSIATLHVGKSHVVLGFSGPSLSGGEPVTSPGRSPGRGVASVEPHVNGRTDKNRRGSRRPAGQSGGFRSCLTRVSRASGETWSRRGSARHHLDSSRWFLRSRQVERRRAHTPIIAGSIPASATSTQNNGGAKSLRVSTWLYSGARGGVAATGADLRGGAHVAPVAAFIT